jgi:predicted RND superfamily exporter protein
MIVMIVFAWGSLKLKTTVTFHGMLPNSAKVIQDYNHLEEKIGGLIPIEVVLEIPDQNGLQPTLLRQLYLLNAIKQSVLDIDAIGTGISALNFLPTLPPRKEHSVSASARRSALTSILPHSEDRLTESRFFDRSNAVATTYWRLSLRTFASAQTDYAKLLQKIRLRIESVRSSEMAQEVGHFDFCVTGGVPLAHRAQNQLLHDLVNSFLTAFILIAVTMMLMLRGIVRGLIAMVPNVFPCILVFGVMGWLHDPVDIGSMMTASVAMGISVDGTLHFMTWFSLGLKEGLDRRDAVVSAYCRCATALTQTAIICGAGMLIFGFSDFIPVSRFAFLLCTLLIASLIGDIIVLPAMLFGRLGKFFES